MDGGYLIPRATVAEICRLRALALEQYAAAYQAMTEAEAALKEAHATMRRASPLNSNRYTYHLDRREQEKREAAAGMVRVPERDIFLAEWKRTIETNVWARIVEETDLSRLMDKQAKDELAQALMRDPPDATEETIYATVEMWRLRAGEIFQRGIANVFSKLDRRFKSHDGFKVGSRVILTGVFDEWGHWSHYRSHRDTLMDIERTFFILDERTAPPEYAGIVGAIDKNRERGFKPHQSDAESDFFRTHCFKNGNVHVWFKRDDLVEKVNKLLAEYYGEVIPDGMTPEDDGGLFTPKTTLAKNYGFFPTPDTAAEMVIDAVALGRRGDEPMLSVLEPSAGTGSLARRCVAKGAVVDCVELHIDRAADLMGSRLYRRVVRADFLTLKPDPARLYDRVVMNPPFDRERDIDHVIHALNFLKPGGQLVAIMSAGTEFRETRKSVAFRAMIEKMKGKFRDLPPGSFASVGTYCNTIILNVWKDGRQTYW